MNARREEQRSEQPRYRLAFVTNFIQHYRVKTFEELSRRIDTEFFLFSKGKEKYWLSEHGTRNGDVKANHLFGFNVAGITISPTLITRLLFGKYDVFLSGVVGKFSMPITYLCARITRKPFILWTGIWQRIDTPVHKLIWPLTKYVYLNADAIVVYGLHIKDYLVSEGAAPDKIFVADHAVQNEVYNTVPKEEELEELRRQHDISQNTRIILYLGRLVKEKGVDDLLIAVAGLDLSVCLIIAGTGPEKEWLEFSARALGIAKRVRFVGYVQPEKAYLYFALADVSVLPSHTTVDHKEPWGLTVNESFNQGTPVIASNSVGAAAGGFLRNGIDGFIYPEGDWNSLRKKLVDIFEEGDRLENFSRNSRNRVMNWDNERMVDGFMRAIDFVNSKKEI